jgi:hypothetical protein
VDYTKKCLKHRLRATSKQNDQEGYRTISNLHDKEEFDFQCAILLFMTKPEGGITPPSILTDVGLNMFVDTAKLRELPLPIIDIDIEELIWHFDMPVWSKDGPGGTCHHGESFEKLITR